MGHGDWPALLSSEEGGVEGDVADVAAGHLQAAELGVVEPLGRCIGGENAAPDRLAFAGFREGKIHYAAQATMEGGVERGFLVAGEDGQAAIGLHALQQVADFDVGVAVVAVLDLAALSK